MEKISKNNIVRILCFEGEVSVESPLDHRDKQLFVERLWQKRTKSMQHSLKAIWVSSVNEILIVKQINMEEGLLNRG